MNEYDNLCRRQIYNNNQYLITKVGVDSEDAKRLGVNCEGFGRIRCFKLSKYYDWIDNPLPLAPVSHAFNSDMKESVPVQVFQVAKCNMNCWWCFLPDKFKNADREYSRWFTVDELLDLYLSDGNDSKVIDLSGGNPELVPEMVLDFMKCLTNRGLYKEIFLWSDDVLSTDYFYKNISKKDQQMMADYKMYGKVACFKGFDDDSFFFNTCSKLHTIDEQLFYARKYIELGFDIYFYQILTCLKIDNIEKRISDFFDRLQSISVNLPLRIVPLKVMKFNANSNRFVGEKVKSIENQFVVLDVWKNEIYKRYGMEMYDWDIVDVVL